MRPVIVAIDGPAGAGKSTAARRLAARLGYAMVDTGAIYRAVALAASRGGIAFDDDARLGELLATLGIRFEPAAGGGQRVLLDGEDVSAEIRTAPISLGASAVSARRCSGCSGGSPRPRGTAARCSRAATSARWSSRTRT